MLSLCSRGIKENIYFIIRNLECHETDIGFSCYLHEGPQGQTASGAAWKVINVFLCNPPDPSRRSPKVYENIEAFFSRRELAKYRAAFDQESMHEPRQIFSTSSAVAKFADEAQMRQEATRSKSQMNAVEKAIAERCVTDLLEAGYLVSVYHDTQPILDRSRELGAILTSMGSADEELLWIRDARDQRVGWISFRYGSSSAANVIVDYTPNLEPVLEQTNKLINVMRSLEIMPSGDDANSDRTGHNADGRLAAKEMPMSDNVKVDRAAVREMVEDIFRQQMLFHQNLLETQPHLSPQQTQDDVNNYVQRLFGRVEATAELMKPEQANIFKQMVDEEYTYLVREFEKDVNGTLRRFGIVLNRAAPAPVYHRQGLGELAVRTAVRATVWELIWSLFRR